MRRLTLVLATTAVGLAVLGSLVPIRGSNLGETGVSVSCGPALPAAMHWTGPPAGAGEDIVTGPDTGLTASAWCEAAAGQWMVPSYSVAALLLGAATLLTIGGLAGRLVSRSKAGADT